MEIENLPHPGFYKTLQERACMIDQIAAKSLQQQRKMMFQKYSNIQNTIKILKNLIIEFNKKADKLQKNLMSTKKIDEIELRDEYYQKRVDQCLRQSDNLKDKIQSKYEALQILEGERNQLRKQLMKLKTGNIKKIMEIQHLQKHLHQQEISEQTQAKKQMYAIKKNQQRMMITSKNIRCGNQQLDRKNQDIERQFCQKIDQFVNVNHFIKDSYALLLQKLHSKQKKSGKYGMTGSLHFKLQNIGAKSNWVADKMNMKKHDSKLMIYDVLKSKYNRTVEAERRDYQGSFQISQSQFLNFTPLQIAGIIQLKGGLDNLNTKSNIMKSDDKYTGQILRQTMKFEKMPKP